MVKMTSFAILAAIMLLAALFTVIRPLLRKPEAEQVHISQVNLDIYNQRLTELDTDLNDNQISREEYSIAQQDLEKQLILDVPDNKSETILNNQRSTASLLTVALLIPALSVGLYLYLGSPEALNFKGPAPQSNAAHGKPAKPGQAIQSLEEMVTKLEQRLEQEPDNAQGWYLLARSYMQTRQFTKAENAYQQLARLADNDPDVWADYADIAAVNQKGSLQGRPYKFIKRALSLQPRHPKALWLAGTYHYQKKEYSTAIRFWKILLKLVPQESKDYKMIGNNIADAQKRLGIQPQSTNKQPEKRQPAATAVIIKGRVQLDKGIAGKAGPTDTVFVYARAARGPRMPLAVVRKQVKDLPFDFTLDDSMAMMPQMKLSAFDRVVISARISKSGNAITQSGDLASDNLEVNTKDKNALQLNINKIVP
ncbi:MAG TPA: c-type cytochrome biogenesis protein CcmI [Gammaproteobacteria bacterium]|nr:c-type cytochrome biogenesis protein CcmI [Gammaproteobacteria bacterium]